MKHDLEIWLRAADDAANSFLSQTPAQRNICDDKNFDCVSVLSSLENLADALYFLDESLSKFIRNKTNQWYRAGMAQAPEFLAAWRAEMIQSSGNFEPVMICDMCGHDASLSENGWYECDEGHAFQIRQSGSE